jgi:asparagine synthase (glutamine-hydrolysing)
MSGIIGWVSYDRDPSTQRTTIDSMLQTLGPYGPRGGVWHAPHVALGHRLSSADPSTGADAATVDIRQGDAPVTLSLVATGQVYNRPELREELSRQGHRFRTGTSAEVALGAYAAWGDTMAERLNGMYALAIWDPRLERLLLIRDRLGVKPLFYAATEDAVIFGSEPKAILAHQGIRPVIDADGFRELLSPLKSRRRGVWAGIREVEPGSLVTVGRGGIREQVYWRVATKPHPDDLPSTVRQVQGLLEDIVRRQLAARETPAFLLSGGLDSSALTALASRELARRGEKVRSFTADYAGQADNFVPSHDCGTRDTPYAHDVADFLGTQHSDVILDCASLVNPAVRRTTVRAADSPVADNSFNSQYLLFKAISEHSAVVVAGDASDEIFGGYSWFHATRSQEADPWLVCLKWIRDGHDSAGSLVSDDILARLELRSYVADGVASTVREIGRLEGESGYEWRMRKMLYLHLTRMLPRQLDRMDRMSNAVGLEVRVPYCDQRLVEYVFNVPWAMKAFDGREKSLLRQAVDGMLPLSVAQREKSGYPLIHGSDYTHAIMGQARNLLAQGHPVLDLIDPAKLRAAVAQDARTPHPESRAWLEQTLSLATWLDLYRPAIRLP